MAEVLGSHCAAPVATMTIPLAQNPNYALVKFHLNWPSDLDTAIYQFHNFEHC